MTTFNFSQWAFHRNAKQAFYKNAGQAFYKNAKVAFYEIAGKVMIFTTLAALLVIMPSIATAQIAVVSSDGKKAFLLNATTTSDSLDYAAVFSYTDTSNTVTGKVTELTTKEWYEYVLPSGMDVSVSKNPSIKLSWDFSKPQPVTKDYNLVAQKFVNGRLINKGVIETAEVLGFGIVGTGEYDLRFGYMDNHHKISGVLVNEYGQLNNLSTGKIETAFIHLSNQDIKDHTGNPIDKSKLRDVARLVNNGIIDNAIVDKGGYLSNNADFVQADYASQEDDIDVLVEAGAGTYIGAVLVRGEGTLNNYGVGAVIEDAGITSGIIMNSKGATIEKVTLYGGTLNNDEKSTINEVYVKKVSQEDIDNGNEEGGLVCLGKGYSGSKHFEGVIDAVVHVEKGGWVANGVGGKTEGNVKGSNAKNTLREVYVHSGGWLTNGCCILDFDSKGKIIEGGNSEGIIETAHVYGELYNGDGINKHVYEPLYNGPGVRGIGTIDTAYIYDGGNIVNAYRDDGHIKTAHIVGGRVENGWNDNDPYTATIGTAFITNDGDLVNRNHATVQVAYVNDWGHIYNYGGTIGRVYLNCKEDRNYRFGVSNTGHIDQLVYESGYYENTYSTKPGCGTIGTLFITEAAYNANPGRWGKVERVVFIDENGNPIWGEFANEEMLFDEAGEMIWDFTNEDVVFDEVETVVCLEENREMLFDEASEIIWDFTDKDELFDENGELLWDFTNAVEKVVQGEVEHDYDFDGAVQDEHGNWWVECKDCGYWGLWIDGEVI